MPAAPALPTAPLIADAAAGMLSSPAADPRDTGRQRLLDKLARECGTAVLAALQDADVTEVMLNPDGHLWVDRRGAGMVDTGVTLKPLVAESMLATCAALLNTVVHYGSPILEGEFPLDGSRLEGLLPPIVRAPAFSLRKRSAVIYTLDDFVRAGVLPGRLDGVVARAADVAQAAPGAPGADDQGGGLSQASGHAPPHAAAPPPPADADTISLLRDAVRERQNLLIVGATGSGKTTLANAVLAELANVAPRDRVIAIEDTQELQLRVPNVVLLRATLDVSMQRLLRATMRLRPDRIVVGEVRGGEALTLLKAWNTGHPGGLATIHANSAAAGLMRLRQLIAEAPEAAHLGNDSIGQMIAEAIGLVVFIERIAEPPGRRLTQIVRVRGWRNGNFDLEPLLDLSAPLPPPVRAAAGIAIPSLHPVQPGERS